MFIVIDGIDGSGKGEVIIRLKQFYEEKGYNVILTSEPTGGEFGRKVRELLKEELDPLKSSLKCLDLFIKDREQHVKNVIQPSLIQPKTIVICDRYYHSTIAYQSSQGIDVGMLIDMNSEFPKPDITFILDLEVDIALERIGIRGEDLEKFEKKEFMERLRQNFLRLQNQLQENIEIIDASKSKEEVFEQIISKLD